MMTPEPTAFVLTSASSRGGVPSEKIRLPVPNRTGNTSSMTSSASPCSSSTGVSVELPQTISCGPLFALVRRMPSTMSSPRSSAGPHSRLFGLWVATYFVAALMLSAIGLFGGFRPVAAPDIVNSPAQQQIESLAVSRDDVPSCFRVGMRPRPSAIREAVGIFFWPAGSLNHAVQRDVFDDLDLSHRVSSNLV